MAFSRSDARAWAVIRSKYGLSRLITAVPPGSIPEKISPFASAMPQSDDGKVAAIGAQSGEPLWIANVAPPGFVEGDRFFTVLVSEFNAIGNPTNVFVFDNGDGTTTEVESPDLGIFLQAGVAPPIGNGFFKIPTCWGIKDTAPYFHDNSSKTLTDLMNHYDDAIFILSETDPVPPSLGQVDLTEQDKADIIAYMNLL